MGELISDIALAVPTATYPPSSETQDFGDSRVLGWPVRPRGMMSLALLVRPPLHGCPILGRSLWISSTIVSGRTWTQYVSGIMCVWGHSSRPVHVSMAEHQERCCLKEELEYRLPDEVANNDMYELARRVPTTKSHPGGGDPSTFFVND